MNLIEISAAIGGWATTTAALIGLARPVRRVTRQNDEFREDWYGQSARPGRSAQPGVMERLASIETQLQTGDGGSLQEAVRGLTQRFEDHLGNHPGGPR